MVQLSDFVSSLADDDRCMSQLAAHCGIDDPAGVRSLYEAATAAVGERVAAMGPGDTAAKALLHTSRILEEAYRNNPRSQFEVGHLVGDELLVSVFGGEADPVVDRLASAGAVDANKARSALEIATAVYLSASYAMAGDPLTVDSLGAVLAGGSGAVSASAAVAGATGAAAGAAGTTRLVEPIGVTETPAAAAAGGGGRAKWWLAAVPAALVVGALVWAVSSGGADDESGDAIAFSDDADADADGGDEATADADVTTGDDTADETADDTGDDTVVDDEPSDDAEAPEDTTGAADDAAGDDDAAAGGTDDGDAVIGGPGPDSPPIPPGAPVRHAVVSQNQFFLRGYVSTPEEAEAIVSTMEIVFGSGNVFNEYIVDPVLAEQYPIGETTVYVAETILFDSGSAVVSPQFGAILNFGVQTLTIEPSITLVVTGHTDSAGSEADNLALSQRRVDAVKQHFVDAGIAPERIEAIGMGESEPVADNATAEGRQANRRVEFEVHNFSFGPPG